MLHLSLWRSIMKRFEKRAILRHLFAIPRSWPTSTVLCWTYYRIPFLPWSQPFRVWVASSRCLYHWHSGAWQCLPTWEPCSLALSPQWISFWSIDRVFRLGHSWVWANKFLVHFYCHLREEVRRHCNLLLGAFGPIFNPGIIWNLLHSCMKLSFLLIINPYHHNSTVLAKGHKDTIVWAWTTRRWLQTADHWFSSAVAWREKSIAFWRLEHGFENEISIEYYFIISITVLASWSSFVGWRKFQTKSSSKWQFFDLQAALQKLYHNQSYHWSCSKHRQKQRVY